MHKSEVILAVGEPIIVEDSIWSYHLHKIDDSTFIIPGLRDLFPVYHLYFSKDKLVRWQNIKPNKN